MNPLFTIFEGMMDMRAPRAIICLSISAGGTGLAKISGVTDFILYSVSCAFLGSVFVIIAERLNTYQPAVIRAVGTER